MTERPDDVLSEVLRALRPRGAAFLDATFRAPWAATSRVDAAVCRPAGEQRHVIGYHYVASGALHAWTGIETPRQVRAGQVLLLPRNDLHALGSAPGLAPVPTHRLLRVDAVTGFATLDHPGPGPACRIVCGFIAVDAVPHPLLAMLPPLVVVDLGAAAGPMVEAMLERAVAGMRDREDGAAASLAAASELLLIEALRAHASAAAASPTGWWAATRDPVVGRALARMHAQPGTAWTAARLATEAGASRSAFAARFTALLAETPMAYLTRWRMTLAAQRLRSTNDSVLAIANALAYGSEAAFSRAFRRQFGVPPAAWRRSVRRSNL